jgi:alkylated DNA repair dioxygenase AlkB
MDLFSGSADPSENLLPYDGAVNYYGRIMALKEADEYFQRLLKNIAWRNDEAVIYGKTLLTKRKVAWYGQKEFEYTYSNTTKYALPFTVELMELKMLCEQTCGETFNSCLLNLYHNGSEGMAWHSDAEKDLKKNGAIASISLGAERKFGFKHKRTAEKVYVSLEHGSLLVMKDQTQTFWTHRLPPTTKIKLPRINLTFRTIMEHK